MNRGLSFKSKIFITVTLLGLFIICFPKKTFAWWDSNWAYRKTVTFNNSLQQEDLTNIPILVKLNASNFNFLKAKSNGEDIRFIGSNDSQALSYEIEKWDSANSQAWIWVKVPLIRASSSSDFIYMYYGNSKASDGQNISDVWSNGYAGVWHMKEASGTTLADSTANANNATKAGVSNPIYTGSDPLDGAQNFNSSGSSDYAFVNDSSSLNVSSITVETWVKFNSLINPATNSHFEALLSQRGGNNGTSGIEESFWFGKYSNDTVTMTVTPGGTGIETWITGTTALQTGKWYDMVATYDEKNIKIYLDGKLETTAPQTTPIYDSSRPLRIGDTLNGDPSSPTIGGSFNGIMDEARISNTARSANWIAAQYQSENGNFNTFGTEEIYYSPSNSNDSSGSPDPNNHTGWSKKVMAGPDYVGLPALISSNISTPQTGVLMTNNVNHDDLALSLSQPSLNNLSQSLNLILTGGKSDVPQPKNTTIPLPWSQGLNTVSEIYQFAAVSAFNGYPVITTDRPFIIQLGYDPARLNGRDPSNLNISYFNSDTGKWTELTTPIAVDWVNNTLATTTKHLGLYAVTYHSNTWPISQPVLNKKPSIVKRENGGKPKTPDVTPVPTVRPVPKKMPQKTCFLFICW